MRWHRRLTVLCAGGTRLAPTETECRPTKHMKNQASDMAGYLLFTVLVHNKSRCPSTFAKHCKKDQKMRPEPLRSTPVWKSGHKSGRWTPGASIR